MYCTKCGAYNIDDRKECSSCGNILEHIENPVGNKFYADDTSNNAGRADVSRANRAVYSTADVIHTTVRRIDYTVFAVLATIFFNKIFGAVALVFSGMCSASLRAGESIKAEEYAKKAKLCCWLSLALGLLMWIWFAFVAFAWLGAFSVIMEDGMWFNNGTWFFEHLIYRF